LTKAGDNFKLPSFDWLSTVMALVETVLAASIWKS
jgi:hypothetical protein